MCQGSYSQAEIYYKESLTLSRQVGNQNGIAKALEQLGWLCWSIGGNRLTEATDYYQQSLMIFREIGAPVHIINALGDFAHVLYDLGNFEKAHEYIQEALAIAEACGNQHYTIYDLCVLGKIACGLGDFESSRQHLRESLRLASNAQLLFHVSDALHGFAILYMAESNSQDLPASVRLEKQTKALTLLEIVIRHPASWQGTRDRAIALRQQLESELAAEVVSTVKMRSASLMLEDVIAELLPPSALDDHLSV